MTHPLFSALMSKLPTIAANATRTEEVHTVAVENIAMIKSVGLHRAFQPEKYGGLDMSLPQFADCIALLAGACASTAWTVSQLCTPSYLLARCSEQLQEEVWGGDPDATASSLVSLAHAQEAGDGGILLSGEMAWSSGFAHAEWAIIGFDRMKAEGISQSCFAVLPRHDLLLADDWVAASVKGPDAETQRFERVLIPAHRIQAATDMMYGNREVFCLYPHDEMFHVPYRPYCSSGFSSVGLGIAERSLRVFQQHIERRTRTPLDMADGGSCPDMMRLVESVHQVGAARAFLQINWQEIALYNASRRVPPDATLTFWRTNHVYAINLCMEVVARLFAASGGHTWRERDDMQYLVRDAYMTGGGRRIE